MLRYITGLIIAFVLWLSPAGAQTSTQLNWNASSGNVSGYNVYRDGVKVGTSATTTFTDTGLTPSTSYTYTVKAFNASGTESTASNSFTVKTCAQAHYTPDGADLVGGCFPGPSNTGVPAGTNLTNYAGDCEIRFDNVTLDSFTFNCDVVSHNLNLTITKSVINGVVLNQAGSSTTLQDTTVHSGNNQIGALNGDNFTLLRVNVDGGQHSLACFNNCSVTDSYLHDQFAGGGLGWHQNAIYGGEGTNKTITHNSLNCSDGSGCTADVILQNIADNTHATVSGNLFVASTSAAYCSYPAGGGQGALTQYMVWTNNVFQRGTNNLCAVFGPINSWISQTSNPAGDGYQNVWSGNIWDDGTTLNPP